MDGAIEHHFGKDIREKKKLTGGYTFQTWLLILSDGQRLVFRTQRDFETGSGRKIIIADVLEREKFFYDNVNKAIGRTCPEVYVIDGTREYYEQSYCVMEYMEGIPLYQRFRDFNAEEKNRVLYKIGGMAARINSIKIDRGHRYMIERGPWEEFVASRLRQRLMPLIRNKVITQAEIDTISEGMRGKEAAEDLSYLHLDLRHVNMIYNDGDIFLLDAENCEFGDPLFDLATIDVAGELAQPSLDGYRDVCGKNIDTGSELFYYYKMERQALVLDLFMNEVKSDIPSTERYFKAFNELKGRLLSYR